MICGNCGRRNDDTAQFCMYCGNPLPEIKEAEKEIPKEESKQPITRQMRKDLLKDKITPAESEVSVRTYYCTYYISRLLGLEARGYLGVTNKRVIFQALGTSNAGASVIQSELPIADVSGISSYKGTYFSFGHIAVALLASFFAFGGSLTAIGILGTLIGAVVVYLSKDLNTSGAGLNVLGWIIGIGAFLVSLILARKSIWKTILASISAASLGAAGGGGLAGSMASALQSLTGAQYAGGLAAALAFLFGFLVTIYTLFCIIWYARRPTFSLAVSSKGGSDTPISISGASGMGLFSVSAGKALTAEPASDAEQMLQELGAVILDVQMLGDMGISKWQVQEPKDGTKEETR